MDAFSKIRTTKRLTNLLFYGILCVIESDKNFCVFSEEIPHFCLHYPYFFSFFKDGIRENPVLKNFYEIL